MDNKVSEKVLKEKSYFIFVRTCKILVLVTLLNKHNIYINTGKKSPGKIIRWKNTKNAFNNFHCKSYQQRSKLMLSHFVALLYI